jgi:probable addiction module antidote protein
MAKAKREKFAAYDSADYLRTERDIAAYLRACMEEAGDDPTFIVQALGTVARAKGMSGLAKKTGLTREGLYKALSKGGNPSFGTVFRVIQAMGLKMELAR